MEQELSFRGRVALVTGAGRGLGREYAIALARRGAAVMVNDIATDEAASAARVAADLRAEGLEADADTSSVGVEEQALGLVRRTIERFGRIDVLVNNAGNSIPSTTWNASTDDFRRVLDVHLMGTFWLQREALRSMREARYGRIVNTASALGAFGRDNAAPYVTAKAGILGLTKAAAIENADHGIRVNAICPIAYTPMNFRYHDNMKRFTPAQLGVDKVSPLVLALAHEACPTNGETFSAGLDRYARVFTATVPGLVDPDASAESLLRRMDAVMDTSRFFILRSSEEQYDQIFTHSPR